MDFSLFRSCFRPSVAVLEMPRPRLSAAPDGRLRRRWHVAIAPVCPLFTYPVRGWCQLWSIKKAYKTNFFLLQTLSTTPLDAETSSFCLKTVVKVGGLSETLISLAYVLAYHCVTILPVLLHLSLCILCFFWGFSLACYAYPTSACLSFLPCDASVGSWAQGALDLTT